MFILKIVLFSKVYVYNGLVIFLCFLVMYWMIWGFLFLFWKGKFDRLLCDYLNIFISSYGSLCYYDKKIRILNNYEFFI